MPPASAAQGITPNPDRGLGLSFLLGIDYEKKKQRLQQELQQDYKYYVSKKRDLKTGEPRPQPQGLSLPIDEKISVKEKLRAERNKEYNLFLQEKAQIGKLKIRPSSVTSKPGQVQASDAVNLYSQVSPLSFLNTQTNIPPPHKEQPASKDAATLTEAVDQEKSTETWAPGYQQRKRWQLHRLKEPCSSEEELNTDKEKFDFRRGRRQDRHTQEPEYKEERTQEQRVNRYSQDVKEVEAPVVHDQNKMDNILKPKLQMPGSMRTASRSTPAISKDKAEFATGLMIGRTEEHTVTQMRKERYKQELLGQIAEQQRNKMKEKRLELRVAATGATDREKKADRIKQFGPLIRQNDSLKQNVSHKHRTQLEAEGKDPYPRPKDDKTVENTEHRAPSAKSQVDFSTALSQLPGKTVPVSGMGAAAARGVPSLDYFNEDYHRDFSNMLGDVNMPRVADVAPLVPPTVLNTYKTPYDAAYYYHGTRNPLDPNPTYNQNGPPGWDQESGKFEMLSQKPPPVRSSGRIEATLQHRASPLAIDELEEKAKQRRQSVLSYQEALKQQIKERQEHKIREKEEKERYDAKIEAEMKAYNPWGRGGGGAPIKDQKGNLVSDLNQMHHSNEESYRNPVFTPGVGPRGSSSQRLSGSKDQQSLEQHHVQDRYKEALKKQIEENKRKQEEDRERIGLEEEKEEQKLAMQRARIQEEYEDEQKKQKKIEHRPENRSWIHEPKTHRQEEEKRVWQEKEMEEITQSARAREEKNSLLNSEREQSPPIPALQRKQTSVVASRPSSAVSQLSSRTEHSVSPPHHRPVPARPQLHEGQQEVMKELSTLRRYLRKEQKQLEVQLQQTGSQETHYTPPNRRRPRVDAFESVHKPSGRSSSPAAARVNEHNIREFNQLKYRDTASREEVRAAYPDPPTDAQSLDMQQRALLREQQRKIRLMNRQDDDFLDNQRGHHHHHPRKKRDSAHRDLALPSETDFIDVYSGGDAREERVLQRRSPQSSAEHRERTSPRRTQSRDEVADSIDQGGRDNRADSESLQPTIGRKSKVRAQNLHRTVRQDTGDHNSRTGPSADEVDLSSLSSALGRRVSVETVATEPWLRPGTSCHAVKHLGCRERPNSRVDAAPWLTHSSRSPASEDGCGF
ncbi:centrosome and spindle pole-associated protein 1 [Embiotoca jacksoni]|uniref:centrosome and spindle pole-associated protein 1 n=1 Tax=Embiotoca jacksoni TaxID=100190 RepID=UPI00370371E4